MTGRELFPSVVYLASQATASYTTRPRSFTHPDKLVMELYASDYVFAPVWGVIATRTAPGATTVDLTPIIQGVFDSVGAPPPPPSGYWGQPGDPYKEAITAHRRMATPLLLAAIAAAVNET